MKLDLKKTIDKKFLIISIAALALLVGLSFVFDGEVTYNKQSLPQGYDATFSKLIISEIVSKNNGVYANENNVVCDYLELYNGTGNDINLSGYGLSDSDKEIKWTFPNVTIKAQGYLVVCLNGENGTKPLQANFSLSSSGGERVILTNPSAKIIDAVDTVTLAENTCMVRDEDGNWYISESCTPGFENSQQGLEEYYQSLDEDGEEKALLINEFLPRNKGNYLSQEDLGFIEFKNISDQTIVLSDYCISNDEHLPFMQQLPQIELQPNEIISFELGDGDYFTKNRLGINLDSPSGHIILSKAGKIVTNLEYNYLNSGNAYFYSNNAYYSRSVISPGYENDATGIEQYQKSNCLTPSTLIISEVMNDNYSYLVQNSNNYYDWIELYNNSDETIRLSDYFLSDSDGNLMKYQLPDIDLKSKCYICIMCSGDENLTNDSYYHSNFKISDDTGLYLVKDNRIVDCVHLANLPRGYSYSRGLSEGWFYTSLPTPYTSNSVGYRSVSVKPVVALDGGVYNDVQSLDVAINADGEIHYTLDGSEPTLYSALYSEPLTISSTCVLKTKSFNNGMISSETTTDSYIVNENHAVSVISISLNSYDFYKINTYSWELDYIKQAYVEFFDGDDGFESNCGLSIYGDDSRYYRKKNYVLRFDKEYGASNIHYKVFEDRDNSDYDMLALRAGGQDWCDAIFTDTLCTTAIDDYTTVATYACRTVVVYVNGEYWGIYTLKEKKSGSYFEDNYNIDSDSVNLLQSNFNVERGDGSGYLALVNYCQNHDLSNDEYYNYVVSQIDLEEWTDYWIGQMYCANYDYFNIRYFSSDQLDDGKWKIIFYDLDYAMEKDKVDYDTYTRGICRYPGFYANANNEQGYYWIDNSVIRSLFENDAYVQYWLQRLAYNLNTTWNKHRMLEKLNQLVDEYTPEIQRDHNEWGLSVSDWQSAVEERRYFITYRQDYVLYFTKNYFNLSDAQMSEIFGDLYG